MAKTYSPALWEAIKKYWENNPKASYNEAAKAVSKGMDVPSKAAIGKKAVEEGWQKKSNQDIQKRADIEGVCHQVDAAQSVQVDGQVDGNDNRQVDGGAEKAKRQGSLAAINKRASRQANAKQAQVDGLAKVITSNIHLSDAEIDDLCADFRADILVKHRGDFEAIDGVVNTCVSLFKKAMDAISSGGYALENDVVDGNGFVHTGLMNSLKLADATLKSMFNASLIKNSKQANERKAYGLDTYEEPNSGGDLAKKAMSQEYMAGHYERIRLSKVGEREAAINKLKEAVNGAV